MKFEYNIHSHVYLIKATGGEIHFTPYDFEKEERSSELVAVDVPVRGVLIEYVSVPQELRRRGYGTMLLQRAMKWARDEFGQNVRFLLQLMTPTDRTSVSMEILQRWYEGHGFYRMEGTTFMIC